MPRLSHGPDRPIGLDGFRNVSVSEVGSVDLDPAEKPLTVDVGDRLPHGSITADSQGSPTPLATSTMQAAALRFRALREPLPRAAQMAETVLMSVGDIPCPSSATRTACIPPSRCARRSLRRYQRRRPRSSR